MSVRAHSEILGQARTRHVLILASGSRIRHITIRPWMAATALSCVGLLTAGYFIATAYFVFRDDLIGATMARQVRMQHDYENRIAALRTQLDQITSRQLIDQQDVEDKVEQLLEQHSALTLRQNRVPVSDRSVRAETSTQAIEAVMGLRGSENAIPTALGYQPVQPRTERSLDTKKSTTKVKASLSAVEKDQLAQAQAMTDKVRETATNIHAALKRTGVPLPAITTSLEAPATGGPFIEPELSPDTSIAQSAFDTSIAQLDAALTAMDTVRRYADATPLDNPLPDSEITSTYGNRTDPFLGRLALHAGIDFRASPGTDIRATGSGTVVSAGYNGGYGLMVEVDHGNGITTRYAHLSGLRVREGETIKRGQTIADSGNTGRSTGPHLHYEIRRYGEPLDPMRFLNAGLKIQKYLN